MSKQKDKSTGVREKISAKLPSKLRKDKTPIRITNDTISEHREKILASGKKFKYPLQYSKHRILVNAIIIVIVAFIALGVWLWVMLYRRQETGDFYYSMTKVLPLSVAEVDGQSVPYSDYLRRIRASIFYYETQEGRSFNSADDQRELNSKKRKELDVVERTAYATKIAKENNISISDAEVDELIIAQRKQSNSDESTFERMLATYNDWTLDDYKAELKNQLLERRVAFSIDLSAKNKANDVVERLKKGEDFAEVAKKVSDDPVTAEGGGARVARSDESDDAGLATAARKLNEGGVSGVIASNSRCGQNADGSDGKYCYYIVRLESKSENETKYSVIQISLTKFDKDFAALRNRNKIREHIDVK